jgi:hypothetical protein
MYNATILMRWKGYAGTIVVLICEASVANEKYRKEQRV